VLVAEARKQIAPTGDPAIRTIGFTGGDPIIHLPYIEEVAAE
jgi:pyruvate formate lyase activating enzyme